MVALTSMGWVLLALLAPHAVSVKPEELAKFLSSPLGLSLSGQEAAAMAQQHAKLLSRCSVTVPMLQALKDAMYSPSSLNLDMPELRQQLLSVAYQHARPEHLTALYKVLYSPAGVNLDKGRAQELALALAAAHAQPSLVGPLYSVLTSPFGPNLPREGAQGMIPTLAAAGADAGQLKSSFLAHKQKADAKAALAAAIRDAVNYNLYGLEQRYAKNALPYTAKEFQDYYGEAWLREWEGAPQQKRTAEDGRDYSASEFLEYYGSSWNAKWAASPVANLTRIDKDGKEYDVAGFRAYYEDSWRAVWSGAKEVLDSCAGLNHDSCDAQAAACQWKWTGDWTTSCGHKPRAAREAVLDSCAGLNHDSCDAQAAACQWKWTGDWTTSCRHKPRATREAVVV